MLHNERFQPANHVKEVNGHTRNDGPNLVNEAAGGGQTPSDLALATITVDQVRDVNLMIDYAIGRGLEIPSDILQDIALAKMQLIGTQVSCEVSARFIAASAKLAHVISPATTRSIVVSRTHSPPQQNIPRTIARKYNVLGVVVFASLLSIQLYWFLLNGSIEDINKTSGLFRPYLTLMERDWQELGNNPTGDVLETRMLSKIGPLRQGVVYPDGDSTAAANLATDTGRGKLNKIDLASLSPSEYLKLKNSPSVEFDRLASLLPWTNINEDDTQGFFEGFGFYNVRIQDMQNAQYILQLISRFFLPIAYGFMGAAVFLVRKISQEYNREALSESSTIDLRLRFFLGGVAGLAIAWFLGPSNGPLPGMPSASSEIVANLSPLVMSFIAGYSVELLFSLIDRVVSSFADTGIRKP